MDADAEPDSRSLTAAERSYDPEPRTHAHPHHQVLFPLEGRMALRIGERPGWVGGGRVGFVAGETEHAFRGEGPNRVLVADVPAALAEVAPGLERVGAGAFLRLDARLAALAATLREEVRGGGLGDPLVGDALGRYLVAVVTGAVADPRPPASPYARRVAREAEAYLRAHADRGVAVAEVAAAVGVSPAHLHRCFRAETGTTIVAFTHGLRLERAAVLLRETDLSVAEVAGAVGFASQSHLTRLFARRYGAPPGRWRARS